jgi:hypothetical protein
MNSNASRDPKSTTESPVGAAPPGLEERGSKMAITSDPITAPSVRKEAVPQSRISPDFQSRIISDFAPFDEPPKAEFRGVKKPVSFEKNAVLF